MSGKPATQAAGGAPRLLLYLAEPAPADAAAPPDQPRYPQDHHLPRSTFFRPQLDSDPRTTVYYKADDGKLVYGPDSPLVQQTDFYPAPRQYCKETKDDGNSDRPDNVKRDPNLTPDYTSIESFQPRLPVESELYQRCLPVGADSSMQTVVVRHNQNQYESARGASETHSDREQDRSYINYQFLEQSVSHQSIVNQSINILNKQVGVNRCGLGEVESGVAPQLVRTPDGVVLAVLPSTVPAQLASEPPELSSRTQIDSRQTIVVPLGWTRIINGSSVVYVSPSGTALSTLPRLREYLQTSGTCKCGLPCPLRPETVFSFDPQVSSKPYQTPTGAELTRLCNHKRKLLATLAARAQSPSTPPPLHVDQKKVSGTELNSKKKMKKRGGYPNMSVSQLMVQRDRPADYKAQDIDQCQAASANAQRSKNQPSLPYGQNISNLPEHEKLDPPVQRSSHYLTVNSGWIQQESIDHKNPNSNSMNAVGMPVLGTNGQIIGVNTGYNKHPNNFKNVNLQQHSEHDKEDKKELGQSSKSKEEEAQIFCGLNQPLTPEVMQKINEQQQLFIQQNQKQIEMAMKGFRTQLETSQNKPCQQNQYMPQGQLVIQNGTVVKTNPAKTPPWQVKRSDNPITSPSPKSQKSDSMDFEESNTTLSEESSNSSSSFQSEHNISQAMCSRVPPLPQHYNMMGQQWPGMDMNKKKPKVPKGNKKKTSPVENKQMPFGSNGMRLLQDDKRKIDDTTLINVPSFMDDPNGYLAQQTVLLNNTINRQVGINSSYNGNQFDGATYGNKIQGDKPKGSVKQPEMPTNIYRNNMVSNPSQSPSNTPDSSLITEKNLENSLSHCCKGYNMNVKQSTEHYGENQMRRTYMKQNMFTKMELEGNATISSPKHNFEDNPVTSSTFIDRSPLVNDNCGPIQAATVSTSNVSPTETLQLPEPSPTPSNSSRNTDTPHSNGSSSHIPQNCTFPMPSPAYSNPGSCRDYNSNPSTPGSGQSYPYNSPGPPHTQSLTGTQMMHFISNHNVNKNLMEVDNISMVGVKPGIKAQEIYRTDGRKRIENSMPGYCPPPHLGGGPAHSLIQACYVQTYVTTMASGFSVTRDTVTSVLAGKANTTTTSINASTANFIRPPPPPSVNLATTYAIPNNHPDPFIHSVNLPTSYPLHIAGTTAQNMISKSPLEMVQNVIGNLPMKSESHTQNAVLTQMGRRPCRTATPGQILISSTGQIMVSNSPMPPPPPKTSTTNAPIISTNVTNVTTSVTQVMQSGISPVVNQPAMVVNTLQTPFVIQPPIMAVDGPVVQQNTVLPQLVPGGMVPSSPNDNQRQIEVKNGQSFVQGVAMLSPESLKRKSKKKKNHTSVTNVLQITAPQQNTNIMLHHSSPQHNTSPQFSPRGFQLSPNNNISPGPMLQALTIVPGKSGTPAHIVMNGQGNGNNFSSQQIITNTSPSQQINLLQPVNLINNASGVVPNFPAFQQFIVPNLGGMVMTADGAIIQDNATGVPMQLQLQTVNGQNVLTPVQNPGVFTGANGGMVIRAQNQQSKIIQSQHSPGAQFLSPNSQVMMNSPNFNGQLSPLLANLSPTSVAFNTSPHQVRSGNVQTQEFIQTNQMGQTLMVPLSPKQVSIASATGNRSNSTFVQQNTTIVQQQTTLVSNSHNGHAALSTNIQGGNASRLSIDPNVLLNNAHKQLNNQLKGRNFIEMPPENQPLPEEIKDDAQNKFNQQHPENDAKLESPENYTKFMNDFNPMLNQMQANLAYGSHVRHSVSTQTLVNQQRGKSPNSQAISGSSPPDTTTHSPLGALESTSSSPRMYGARSMSTQGNYADTTTKSPEPADANSSAMVQCVSSSEQDIAEAREHAAWSNASNEFSSDSDTGLMSNIQLMRQTRHTHNSVESTEMQYSSNLNQTMNSQQNVIPMTSNYYDRQTYKRKNEFGDNSSYRHDKLMRTSYNMVHGQQKEGEYDLNADKTPKRHFSNSSSSSDMQKVFDRHGLGNDTNTEESPESKSTPEKARKFEAGDLIWGPVKGYASWPGKLMERSGEDKWTVRWFGADKAVGSVEDGRLLTLTEGLEAHHAARTKHRKSRKLNTLLENAIQEAMSELDKKTERAARMDEQPDEASGSRPSITETPKRGRKEKKHKDKLKKTGNLVKIAPNLSKSGDGARLRSSR